MAEQLPIITKSHAVNTTASPASSLLGRGLNAIQSRNSPIPREIDETKLLEVMCRIMNAAFRLGHCTFKENAKFVLDTIRVKLGDDIANTLDIDDLQAGYIAMKQGTTSTKDVVNNFESIGDLYLEEELLKVGIETAVYHIKRGIRKYPEYTQAMITSLGENIRPYLAQIYVCIKFQPEPDFDNSGMEDAETIERIISANQSKSDSQHD
jgi:hypothetical protein